MSEDIAVKTKRLVYAGILKSEEKEDLDFLNALTKTQVGKFTRRVRGWLSKTIPDKFAVMVKDINIAEKEAEAKAKEEAEEG